MTVYIDIIWLLNFLFDTMLLYLTALIGKREIKFFRLIAGGLIGSIIIVLSFTALGPVVAHPVVKLLFSIMMILSTFGFRRFRTFMRTLFTFYLITFGIGGAIIGTHYFIQYDQHLTRQVLISSVQGFGDPISWVFVIFGFPIAWHFSRARYDQLEMTKIHYDQLVGVELTCNDWTLSCKGLVDSGNQLIDPISRIPVMFISIHHLTDQMPGAVQQLASRSEEIMNGRELLESSWENRLRIIPMKVVGKEHQLILAIKPDQLVIETEKGMIQVDKALVSFTNQQLSSDESYQCILHPQMVTKRYKSKETVKVS